MKPTEVIRPARKSDQGALLDLIRAYYRFDRIAYDSVTVPRALGTLLRDSSLGRIWVAEKRGRLIGYAIMTFNYDLEFGGSEGLVTDLYVAARWRKRGIGRGLIDAVRAFCHEAGIGTIELQVTKDNRAARAFYASIGFREFDWVVMALNTAPNLSAARKGST